MALKGLRTLGQQLKMQENSSITETEGVLVECTSAPLPDEVTAPFAGEGIPSSFYMYRMRIENCSPNAVQLVGRHLQFFTRGRLFLEIPKFSPGVVGHTPILQPHESFEYISGTNIPLDADVSAAQPERKSGPLAEDVKKDFATGSMMGSFQMVRVGGPGGGAINGSQFDAHFGPLRLAR